MRVLALSYAPEASRAGMAALFDLDAALGDVLRTTREPMVGRMRLAWWREALERLDVAPAPAEPVLRALAAEVVGRGGIGGARLSEMVEGWEWLLETPLDARALRRHAALRGEIFATAAMLCGYPPARWVARAGRGWAWADLAGHLNDAGLSARARGNAGRLLRMKTPRWPFPLRALGALALIARADLDTRAGAGLVARLGWMRLIGR